MQTVAIMLEEILERLARLETKVDRITGRVGVAFDDDNCLDLLGCSENPCPECLAPKPVNRSC